ncbi:MAG: preprotein translocase subunit SecG [Planctomycetota bacterium]|nr:MAG: preprotein translocase subunit SecG [Planctomycetota bacterium]
MNFLFALLTVLFIVVSIALVLIVLVQRPQGGGLTGAFGGGGGTDTAFGGRTGDALTVATITAFAIYLLIAIGLNILSNTRTVETATPAAATTAPDGTIPATDPAIAPATTTAPAQPIPMTNEEKQALLGGTKPAPAAPEVAPTDAPTDAPTVPPTDAPVTPEPTTPASGGG